MLTDYKIPITVGIVGHLDAVVTEAHIAQITRIFDGLDKRYPASPVCLFSQLAEGADMAVARLFMDMKDRTHRDYHLVVPLPFPPDSYETRFQPPEDLSMYLQLLGRSSHHFVVDNHKGDDDEDHYRAGGQWVADSSIVLIAIWDGQVNNKKGGTGEIVNYKKDGSFPDGGPGPLFEKKGSLIEIPCARKGAAISPLTPMPADPLPALLEDKSIAKALVRIDQMNAGNRKIRDHRRSDSSRQLISETVALTPIRLLLRGYYSQTDSLAIWHRRAYVYVLKALFLMGLLIIGVFEWYKHRDHSRGFLATVLGVIVVTYLFNLAALRWKNHLRFLECRVLCEALRIQFFWDLSGIRKKVADHILRIHKAEFNWIKHILFAIYGICHDGDNIAVDQCHIQQDWIVGQFTYLERRLKGIVKVRRRLRRWSRIALLTSVAIIVGIFIAGESLEEYHMLDYFIIAIGMLLGIFALTRAYMEKRGYHQLENQYMVMREIFVAAMAKTSEVEKTTGNDPILQERINEVYYQVGCEALIQNGNWYLLYKDKEPEFEGI